LQDLFALKRDKPGLSGINNRENIRKKPFATERVTHKARGLLPMQWGHFQPKYQPRAVKSFLEAVDNSKNINSARVSKHYHLGMILALNDHHLASIVPLITALVAIK
jgi:hypothetical protein